MKTKLMAVLITAALLLTVFSSLQIMAFADGEIALQQAAAAK